MSCVLRSVPAGYLGGRILTSSAFGISIFPSTRCRSDRATPAPSGCASVIRRPRSWGGTDGFGDVVVSRDDDRIIEGSRLSATQQIENESGVDTLLANFRPKCEMLSERCFGHAARTSSS